MLDLLLLPFKLAWELLVLAFDLISGFFSLVFGLLGGLVSLVVGLVTIALIAGLIALAIQRRQAYKASHEQFDSFYAQDGKVE